MRTHKIAAIPGDGIGPEVIAAGLEVLEACAERDGGFELDVEHFDWGSDYYKKHGVMMPPGGHEQLRGFDALYFGAVGAPDVPDHITLWGLRLAICQPLDQYANVRPTRILPGITSPLRKVTAKELDWVIVRENSEGEYAGQGGRSHRGPAARGRHRGRDLHPRRRDPDHALRLRARPLAAAQAARPWSPSPTPSATAW